MASSSNIKEWYSKYHMNQPCSNCCLCGMSSPLYSHYAGWGEDEKEFLRHHCVDEPEPSACTCIAHQKEAKRSHTPGYLPKWSKLKPINVDERNVCAKSLCNFKEKLITPLFAPASEIRAALQIEQDHNLVLCTEHYQELYRQLIGARPCASCNIKPKKGTTHFTRLSPNADLINKILGEGSEQPTSNDCICTTCYKSHVAIVKSHENENQLYS